MTKRVCLSYIGLWRVFIVRLRMDKKVMGPSELPLRSVSHPFGLGLGLGLELVSYCVRV